LPPDSRPARRIRPPDHGKVTGEFTFSAAGRMWGIWFDWKELRTCFDELIRTGKEGTGLIPACCPVDDSTGRHESAVVIRRFAGRRADARAHRFRACGEC